VTSPVRVVVETGPEEKKVFASALDWPGWSRSGKTEAGALEALADYAERYQAVVNIAGTVDFPAEAPEFEVVEQLTGSGATDFGVPERAAACEAEPMSDEECERQIGLMRACWTYFDDVASTVSAELRKGPRGGGRDRDKIIEHVYEAERGYSRRIGVTTPNGVMFTADGLAQHRDAVCDSIRRLRRNGEAGAKWPLRYFVRRAAWHVMDHAWEMQDKKLS
jgi:hypothetical protein